MKLHKQSLKAFVGLTMLVSTIQLTPANVFAGGGHSHDEEKEGSKEEGHGEEGTLELAAEALKNSGVTIEEAKPAELNVTLDLTGRLIPNEDKVTHVVPRFPGIIREVFKKLGDRVEKGDLLAIVESNSTIQRYEVRALLSGIVTKRHATLGEYAGEASELFIVSDYSELFADFFVYPNESRRLAVGQQAIVNIPGHPEPISSTVTFISPIVDTDNQSRIARVVLSNEKGDLQPGTYVSAGIVTEKKQAAVAVLSSSIQNIEGQPKIFLQKADHLVATDVTVGASDRKFSEITAGVKPGDKYAAGKTFVLKAELGKSEAEHEH